MNKMHFVPQGYHAITPYLIVDGAAQAIEFYVKAFGAKEKYRMDGPPGKIAHAEIIIGDSHLMLSDEMPDKASGMSSKGPKSLGGTPFGICLYVPDVDAVVKAAVAHGAKLERPVEDQFYGDRSGAVVDPFGHKWTISTHIEDVEPKELERRMNEWMKNQAKG
jgi:PhnB protein